MSRSSAWVGFSQELATTACSLFWMLGWSSGVALLLLLFLGLIIGRETLHVSQNRLTIRVGIPGIALAASYSGDLIRSFQYRDDAIIESKKWRGHHSAFDYGGMEIGLGSDIGGPAAYEIISRLEELIPLSGVAPVELQAPATPFAPKIAAIADSLDTLIESNNDPSRAAKHVRWNSLSGISLILANLIPLFGVLLAGWDIGEIMLLFWAESAIIGYYNLCKMGKVGGWSLLFYGPFFIGHYGAFMAVHLLFIYALFGGEIAAEVDVSRAQVLTDMLALWPALLGLLISHGISYYFNFVKTEKFRDRTMSFQMKEPYRRIIIMHLTLIFGGFLTLILGSGVGALMLLLCMKIVADLCSHLSQHAT